MMTVIINSLYSNKEVFLRELIRNDSNPFDKKRFLLPNSGREAVSSIYVKADKNAGVISIEDKDVGMARQELINNL